MLQCGMREVKLGPRHRVWLGCYNREISNSRWKISSLGRLE